MNKKLIAIMLSVALFVVTALHVHGEDLKTGKFFLKNIVINGVEISNYNLLYPFVLYDDITYMPMTAEIGEICGFSAEFNTNNKVLKLRETAILRSNLLKQQPQNNGEDPPVTLMSDSIVLKMNNQNASFEMGYPMDLGPLSMIFVNGIPYMPLRALASEAGLNWNLYYDPYYGICISTKADTQAVTFFSQEQADYNRQLQSYIMSSNKAVRPTLALDYVFLFERASKVTGLDIKMLMAIAQIESNFRHDAVSRSGARGMMQLMPQTGKSLGLSPDQLLDPRLNIFYGAAYLKHQLSRFGDNIGLALSAYNMGSGAVSRGGYSRAYVEKVHGYTIKVDAYLNTI
ncbi:MAG: lytic transglycosylase domain-containing protein [Oscillospiraceae bacterium]|nr:lytic transglycosylase domain-containing protein [Oscillospiraceae bacterium]